jgi:hypothetical protein
MSKKLTGKAKAKARKVRNAKNKVNNPNINSMFTMSPAQKTKLIEGFKPDVGFKLTDKSTDVDYVYISISELAEGLIHHQSAGQGLPMGVYNLPCQLGEDIQTEYFGTFQFDLNQNYQLADLIYEGAMNVKLRVTANPEQIQTGLSGESYVPCKVEEVIKHGTSDAGANFMHMMFIGGNMKQLTNKHIADAIIVHTKQYEAA